MNRNTERNYFPIQHFVHTYTRNSKTTGRMLTFYISNDCSTIGDVNFLCYSWVQDMNGELSLQTRTEVSFWQVIFAYTMQLDVQLESL